MSIERLQRDHRPELKTGSHWKSLEDRPQHNAAMYDACNYGLFLDMFAKHAVLKCPI